VNDLAEAHVLDWNISTAASRRRHLGTGRGHSVARSSTIKSVTGREVPSRMARPDWAILQNSWLIPVARKNCCTGRQTLVAEIVCYRVEMAERATAK